MQNERKTVVRRFVKGYVSLAAMMLFVLTVSLLKGSDWKVLIVGASVFLTIFVGISYRSAKEMLWSNRSRSKGAD
ncbi:hypothetical protein FRZ40_35585 [Paraburkholderia azotifigens]|uniref:Uncharacterized protein n=1 Tax=Paraburkholderia azotifigens TaxID=2057004 RepID=A0A5C6V357_9BURK|nr:hypothetical protein FRZ40_35585 [Paraburkholderia azotifigens]